MLPIALYTYLRVIVDHGGANFAALRQKEVDFCISLLREKVIYGYYSANKLSLLSCVCLSALILIMFYRITILNCVDSLLLLLILS